jgi:hypothetical protein
MKYFKLLLPAILCVLILYITKMSILYYPLSFGLVIGLVNWKLHKYNPYIGVLLSVLVSLISFWLAFFSIGLFSNLGDLITSNTNYVFGDGAKIYYLIVAINIIAPILVFTLYKFVFKIYKTKFSLYIIISSIILLVLVFILNINHYSIFDFRLLPYTIWQFIMALALQIIITQNTLKKPKL